MFKEITEGRLSTFDHNIVPILLRTKLKPVVEDEELSIDRDRLSKQIDVNKQVSFFLCKTRDSMCRCWQNLRPLNFFSAIRPNLKGTLAPAPSLLLPGTKQ